jgi:two-component system, NarL family, sensor histidine kinase UhpB
VSLNFRLNLAIFVPCLLVLLLGTLLVVANARQAVSQETEASAAMLLQLLTAVTISSETASRQERYQALALSIGELEQTRHLNVALLGRSVPVMPPASGEEEAPDSRAPAWFSRLVTPPPQEYRRRLSGPGLPFAEIVIRADARDEIAEAWQESRVVLGLLVLFAGLAAVLVFLTVRRALAPVDRVLVGLGVVERGDYAVRMPEFKLPEMQRLAEGFNHMAEVLEAQRRDNRELSKRSLSIQESERRHLARELHDELGQSVSAIKAMAISMARHPEAPARFRDGADSIVSACDRIYGAVRTLMNRLRPAVVDELGLRLGLERTVDDWNAHHEDVFCRLSVEGIDGRLGEEIQIAVYRIVQECLTNVARHAGASTVDVLLKVNDTVDPPVLRLQVRDDGRGFDPAATPRGLGLAGMRERVESLGGEMRIAATGGVDIRIAIPLEPALREDAQKEGVPA